MSQFCILVTPKTDTKPSVFVTGPFFDIEQAEKWVAENAGGYWSGCGYQIRQLLQPVKIGTIDHDNQQSRQSADEGRSP
jgi:hypothetical protein